VGLNALNVEDGSVTNMSKIYNDLPKFHEWSFDWLSWRNGTLLLLLGVENRSYSIRDNRDTIRKYAIGWCEADNIPCRPKEGEYVVMFSVDDVEFWTHFRKEEFEYCFVVED